MNIITLMERLIDINPSYQYILTNCITSEINTGSLSMKMPDVPKLSKYFEKHREQLADDLKKLFAIELKYCFSDFKMPFLPHPAQGGKYTNYLLFIFPDGNSFSFCIVKKNHLHTAMQENGKINFLSTGTFDHPFTNAEIFLFLEKTFSEMYDTLKSSWTYLHTIIPFTDCESLFLYRILIENVMKHIEKSDIKDIRRFVGVPCFTPIDYKEILHAFDVTAKHNA
jgi:hypothetical protein